MGNRIITNTPYATDGSIANLTKSTANADGTMVTIAYDNNGDGVIDKAQTILTTVDGAGTRTETLTKRNGGGILTSAIQTITSIDGISEAKNDNQALLTWKQVS